MHNVKLFSVLMAKWTVCDYLHDSSLSGNFEHLTLSLLAISQSHVDDLGVSVHKENKWVS